MSAVNGRRVDGAQLRRRQGATTDAILDSSNTSHSSRTSHDPNSYDKFVTQAPPPSFPFSLIPRVIMRAYFRYEVETTVYMLEGWEKVLANTAVATFTIGSIYFVGAWMQSAFGR